MRLRWLFLLSLAGLMLVFTPQPTQAQVDAGVCPLLVQQALEQMGDNCTGMDRNNACYGYNHINSTFIETMPQDFFSLPADRTGLAQIESLATMPLDLDLDQWGIAVMNVQANVPTALPGQAVVFMLMGDAEVTNAVAPDAMVVPVEPLNLMTQAATQVFTGPAPNTSTMMIVPADTLLPADGLSEDGLWLRVYADQHTGWAQRAGFGAVPDVDTLPVITNQSQTPMQSFQVRTAFNDLLCDEAPSLLAVQSPEGMKVDLTANGVHIRLGSLVMVRTVPPGNAMQVLTIEGDVVLDPGTPNELPLPAGFLTQRCLNGDNMVYDGCGWLPPLPMTETELMWAQTVLRAYQLLGSPDSGSLVIDGANVTLINTDSCPTGTTLTHTVQPGDNLYQLGLRYSTSANAILFGNSLTSTDIFPGQELEIVCGAPGPASLPSLGAPPIPVSDEPPPPVDCSRFRATSPLDGIAYGNATFYWDAAPGATQYRVNIVGESGTFSFTTSGNNLSLTADTSNSSIGFGFGFQWNVEALYNSAVSCRTPLAGMMRESQPPGRPQSEPPRPAITRTPQFRQICDPRLVCLG